MEKCYTKRMKRKTYSLLAYTISHFCVDFICFYFLFGTFSSAVQDMETRVTGFLIYNILAFGLQIILGYLKDKRPSLPIGIVGILLLFLALFLPSIWIGLGLVAIGNAMFHIEGGIDSLKYSDGKCRRSGIFVSAGALGVGLGTLAGKNEWFLLALLLCVLSFVLLMFIKPIQEKEAQYHLTKDNGIEFILLLCFIGVFARAFAGSYLPIQFHFFLSVSIFSCLGKLCGGYLADWLGTKKVAMISLILAIVFALFAKENAICSALYIFAINITMPISLCALASLLPSHYGFAFGLSTLALVLGTIPSFYFVEYGNISVYIIVLLVSLMCTNMSLRKER